MNLSVGIVGLPNVGKSTLFNALLKKQQAYVANFPFATIEPNVGIVPVPDARLEKLAEVIGDQCAVNGDEKRPPPIVPAIVEFVDIAGLIAGAHKGEGLGNKFLSYIRQVDAIAHVVRVFSDVEIIKEGSVDPKSDFEIIKTELELADLEMTDRASIKASAGKKTQVENLPLFSRKPFLVVLNVDESDLKNAAEIENKYATEFGISADQVVAISAKTEEQLSEFTDTEAHEYLEGLGVNKSGLERLIKKAFDTLGLMTFLTAPASAEASARQGGEYEVRAWTIQKNMRAQDAAGAIHDDFIKKFIKADVVNFEDFITNKGWKTCRELGKVRSEGRDYIMQDGDIIEFKIGG